MADLTLLDKYMLTSSLFIMLVALQSRALNWLVEWGCDASSIQTFDRVSFAMYGGFWVLVTASNRTHAAGASDATELPPLDLRFGSLTARIVPWQFHFWFLREVRGITDELTPRDPTFDDFRAATRSRLSDRTFDSVRGRTVSVLSNTSNGSVLSDNIEEGSRTSGPIVRHMSARGSTRISPNPAHVRNALKVNS